MERLGNCITYNFPTTTQQRLTALALITFTASFAKLQYQNKQNSTVPTTVSQLALVLSAERTLVTSLRCEMQLH